ncbi:hypothetical protein ACP3TI_13305, partial [Desulforudis sp. 1190]
MPDANGFRVGVFVCDCQTTLNDAIDMARLAERAGSLAHVVFVRKHNILCEEGLEIFKNDIREQALDRVIVVGCSPRTSLMAPEQRFKRAAAETGLE